MNNVTLFASNSFQFLNVSNYWNIPYNHLHVISKQKCLCENCGGEHYSTDFPHPHDETKIKDSKEERAACRGNVVRGVLRGCGHKVTERSEATIRGMGK